MAAKTSIRIRIPDQLSLQEEDEENWDEGEEDKLFKNGNIERIFGLGETGIVKKKSLLFAGRKAKNRFKFENDRHQSKGQAENNLEDKFRELQIPTVIVTQYEEEKEEDEEFERTPEPKQIIQGWNNLRDLLTKRIFIIKLMPLQLETIFFDDLFVKSRLNKIASKGSKTIFKTISNFTKSKSKSKSFGKKPDFKIKIVIFDFDFKSFSISNRHSLVKRHLTRGIKNWHSTKKGTGSTKVSLFFDLPTCLLNLLPKFIETEYEKSSFFDSPLRLTERLKLPLSCDMVPEEFAGFITSCQTLVDAIKGYKRDPIQEFLDSIPPKMLPPKPPPRRKRYRFRKKPPWLQVGYHITRRLSRPKVVHSLSRNRIVFNPNIEYHRHSCDKSVIELKQGLERYQAMKPSMPLVAFEPWAEEEKEEISFLNNILEFEEEGNEGLDLTLLAEAIQIEKIETPEKNEFNQGNIILEANSVPDSQQTTQELITEENLDPLSVVGTRFKKKKILKRLHWKEEETDTKEPFEPETDYKDQFQTSLLFLLPPAFQCLLSHTRLRDSRCSYRAPATLCMPLTSPRGHCRCRERAPVPRMAKKRTVRVVRIPSLPRDSGLDFIRNLMRDPLKIWLDKKHPTTDESLPRSSHHSTETPPSRASSHDQQEQAQQQAAAVAKKKPGSAKNGFKGKGKGRGQARPESPEKGFYDNEPELTQIAASSRGASPDISHFYHPSAAPKREFCDHPHGVYVSDSEGIGGRPSPLERRALYTLEEQLKLEERKPAAATGKHDSRRLQEIEEQLQGSVRTSLGRDCSAVEKEISELDEELAISRKENDGQDELDDEADFWLHLPRTFSPQSARFELPLNMNVLTEMKPVEYLSRFVAVSSARRQLYDKVFVRHRSLKDGLLTDVTTILALEEVLGGNLSQDQQSRLWLQLGIVLKPHIVTAFTYKQFSGIAAFSERVYCDEFADPNHRSDSNSANRPRKSEIEVADFDRLLSKIERVDMQMALREMLTNIKESGGGDGEKEQRSKAKRR